jgi:DNA-binding NarL/FixJ family response regulator
MTQSTGNGSKPQGLEVKPLGLIWIICAYPMVAEGLGRALEKYARVHISYESPKEVPSSAILCTEGAEELPESIRRIQRTHSDISILIFGLHMDLPLAQAALGLGARGFIHIGMKPSQIVRAVEVAAEGELVAPRQLLKYLIAYEAPVDLGLLSARQREILELVVEGLSNAEVARRVFLSESTVKQHLRGAYKTLNVSNRTEAAKLFHNGS